MDVRVAFLVCATIVVSAPAMAADGATGPAATAALQWYSSDQSLGCLGPDAVTVACGAHNEPVLKLYYGNADGGPGAPDVLAVVLYLPDPTGNAQSDAVALFRREADGFHFVRRLPNLGGHGLVPGSLVSFGNGRATVTVLVPKPGESGCCLTGRKTVELPLRTR